MTVGVCKTPGCGPVSDKAPRCPRCHVENPYLPAEIAPPPPPPPSYTPPTPPPAPPATPDYYDDAVEAPRYESDERSPTPTLTITPAMIRFGLLGLGVAVVIALLLFWFSREPSPSTEPEAIHQSAPVDPNDTGVRGPPEPYETDAAPDIEAIDAPPPPQDGIFIDPAAPPAMTTVAPQITPISPPPATTVAPPTPAAARGFVESAIGNTLRVTAPNGIADYYYFSSDGSFSRRRGRDTFGGRWARSGTRMCVTPTGGQPNCFDDTTARTVGETWTAPSGSGTATYSILRGIQYPATTAPPPSPPPPPSPQQPLVIENPVWVQRPTLEDMQRYYPRRALENGEAGRVILDCSVIYGGRLSCRVRSETPSGQGFGEAAIAIAREFRIAATQPDGTPTNGARLTVPIVFQVDDNDGRRR